MDRTDAIRARLTDCFTDLGMAVVLIDVDRWEVDAPEDPTNLYRDMGWLPATHEESGAWVFSCCPERIAQVTAHLPDDKLMDYLDAVDWTVSAFVVHDKLPVEEKVRTVDDLLYAAAPGSMALLSETLIGARG